jgi:hypothetical protein
MGRPSEYTPETADAIVAWLSEGMTLREFCRQAETPHYSTVYDWMTRNEEFAQRIARARLIGEEVIHQQCLEIADNTQMGVIVTKKPDGTTETKTADMIEHRKLRIYTRLQLLAKWNPKKYGDKVVHSGDQDQPLVVRHIGKQDE